MKWSDLEVGDVIKVNYRVKKAWHMYPWANRDLKIIHISFSELDDKIHINVDCENSYFRIRSNGVIENYEDYGEFFEIVELSDK